MSRLVARNAVWNILGTIMPLAAGLFAIPMLISGLGEARLGIFTLFAGLMGFSGIFDLGLGRALTQSIAWHSSRETSDRALAQLSRRAMAAVALIGSFWGMMLWLGTGLITHSIFGLDGELAAEAAIGVRWLAIILPIVLISSSLVGVLEGLQKYAVVNSLKAPLAVATFMVPALYSQIQPNVGIVVGSIVAVRLLGLVAWAIAANQALPLLSRHHGASIKTGKLWRTSGWISVTNLVGPMLIYADRFYLANMLPPSIVAHYTVPLDTISRVASLPVSAINVLFPAFAATGSHSDESRTFILMAAKLLLLTWVPVIFIATVSSEYWLSIWLGTDFSAKVLDISKWLLLGVLLTGFAYIPFTLLQAKGFADRVAKLHTLELPVYAILVVTLVGSMGIEGAALAWCLRVAFDALGLFLISVRQFPTLRTALVKTFAMASLCGLALLSTILAM